MIRMLTFTATLACVAAHTNAADRHVPSQFPTIQSAIDACTDGDRVLIAPGSYAERFDFGGKRIVVESTSGPSVTLIDLTNIGGGTAVTATSAEPIGARLKGIALRGGTASLIRVEGAALAIENCRLESSSAGQPGGAGIRCHSGSMAVVGCTFSALRSATADPVQAIAQGGAVVLSGESTASFTSCSFTNCSARASGGQNNGNTWTCSTPVGYFASGGAIAASGSVLEVVSCQFAQCDVSAKRTSGWGSGEGGIGHRWNGACIAKGGAIHCMSGSSLDVRGSRFASCSAMHQNKWDPLCCAECSEQIGYASGSSIAVESSGCAIRDTVVESGYCSTAFPWSGSSGAPCGITGNARPRIVGTRLGAGICISGTLPSQAVVANCVFTGGISEVVPFPNDSNPPGATNIYTKCQSGSAWIPCELLWNSTGLSIALGANAVVSDCTFMSGNAHAQAVVDGGLASFIRCSFAAPQGSAAGLRCIGSSPVVFASSFRGASGAPVISDGPGSLGPIISFSTICSNGFNGVSGPWTDGGSNTFSQNCVDNDCNGNGIDDAADIASGLTPDCNGNGVPDLCDIASETAADCNGNGVPDVCELPVERRQSPTLAPVQYGTLLTTSFTQTKRSGTPVTLRFVARGDLSDPLENIQVRMNGNIIGTLWQTGGADCTQVSAELALNADTFNGAIESGSGSISFVFTPSFAVTAGQCPATSLTVSMEYLPIVVGDCNGNGNPDSCDVASGESSDTNQNGVPDECEDLPCPEDLNGDALVNGDDLGILLGAWGSGTGSAADLNGDGAVNGDDLGMMLGSWGPCS